MPLPTSNSGENQNDFISRCMSDSTAKQDFPDNKQRLAVCFSKFKRPKSKEFQYEVLKNLIEKAVLTDLQGD